MRTITRIGPGLILFLLTMPTMASEPNPFRLSGNAAPADCGNCHAWRAPNPQHRLLAQPHHALRLGHGPLWCLDCHTQQQPDRLQPSGTATPIPFADAWRLCAWCHGRQARDWRFGAHGKRLDNWQGERTILSCTACHNPHAPTFKPMPAAPPPRKPGNKPS